jgi:hypothetical protein
MPIYVTVCHLDKMIIGKTEGDVSLADIEGYLDDIVKARAVPYRKIFDASSGTSVLTPEDFVALRNKLAEFTQSATMSDPSPWSPAATGRAGWPTSARPSRRPTGRCGSSPTSTPRGSGSKRNCLFPDAAVRIQLA